MARKIKYIVLGLAVSLGVAALVLRASEPFGAHTLRAICAANPQAKT